MSREGFTGKINTEEIEKCPECYSSQLIRNYIRGELVCNGCGLVLEETYIDYGAEWSAYGSEEMASLSRTGAPISYVFHDRGLSTEIPWTNRDSHGQVIPKRNRQQIYRARLWQDRFKVSNSVERGLIQALQELERISSTLGIPNNVRETAALIYRKALKAGMVSGRGIEAVVAASVYAACRKTNTPRSLDEISSVSLQKKKQIGKCFRALNRYTGLELQPPRPEDYLTGFCRRLNLTPNTRDRALEIIKKAENRELLNGRSPNGVVAAAIYCASCQLHEKCTLAAISHIAGVTGVTIRKRVNEFSMSFIIENGSSL